MGSETNATVGAEASDAVLYRALEQLAVPGAEAVSLPFLTQAERAPLLAEARGLPYRAARPVVGEGSRAVLQEFHLTEEAPPQGALAGFARALEARLRSLGRPWLEPGFALDDLMVQRYPAGSRGITPHRDHLRYRGLVALLTLAGRARLFLCADRSGSAPREIAINPGRLVLLRAPGFAGAEERPFHFLTEVAQERFSLGLRHDTRRAA